MIFLDLFEQDPNFRKPVEYQNTKQYGTVNLANFIKAYQSNQPVQFDFPGGRSYKLSPQWVDMLGDYYNTLETQNDKAQLVYYVLTDYNKTIRLLNDLAQSKLFEKKSLDPASNPEFKSTKLSRLKTQARAKYPAANSDMEAMVADFVDAQEKDQQEFDRVKSSNLKQDELLKQITAINQAQDQEIDGLDSDRDTLQKNIQQLRSVNTELAKKLAAMAQRKPKAKTKDQDVEPSKVKDQQPWVPPSAADTKPDWTTSAPPTLAQPGIPTATPATVGGQPATVLAKPKRKRRTKAEIDADRAGKAAMAAMTKAAGGAKIKPVQPDIPPAPTAGEPAPIPPAIPKTINLFPGVTDINTPVTPQPSSGDADNIDNVHDLFPGKLQKAAESVEEGSVFGQQDFDTQMDLAKLKSKLTQPKAAQTAPATTTPGPQPVAYQSPSRLSDLQARQQKFANLASIKKDIETLQAQATRGGRMLPRGLAADLEDYFTTADVDSAYDDMMAKYQKQLSALQQYLGMRKVLWSPKKDVHEMRAKELQESKSEVWTVHFTDGTAVRVRVSDETDPAMVRKHYANKGKTVAKFDYGYGAEPEAGPGPEAHEPGSGRAVSGRTGETLPEDTKSEFKALALAKIKKALDNPKLDPTIKKDFEARLAKIQALEEGNVININRGGHNAFRDRADWLDKRDYIQRQLLDPRQRDNYPELKQRLLDINDAGRKLGYTK